MTALTISLLVIGAISTAFFSGIKAALSSCDKLILDIDIRQRVIRQGVVFRPTDNIGLCTTLMHTGEIVSLCLLGIALTALLGIFTYPAAWIRPLITLAAIVASIIIFDTLPAALMARKSNESLRHFAAVASAISNLIYPWLYIVLFPVVARAEKKGVDKFNELLPFQDDTPTTADTTNYHDNDFKILLNALDFTNIKIRECLVPRNEIVFAFIDDSIETLAERFINSNYSKILICDKTIDNVKGYVNALSLFKTPKSIKNILTNAIEVPETMTAEHLFKLFIKRRLSVAIVIDEYGGTAGMLTVEDIIEEIIGEIEDEHDSQDFIDKQTGPNEYILAGRLEIDYINEKYQIGLPKSDDYETLAGYILKLNEDIPKYGDEITDGPFCMKILQVKRPKIEIIRLRVNRGNQSPKTTQQNDQRN
ncbi:MAG: CBS domain-containing protein [Bacteroidales bacterium]|nr:CBS domain-containing protein [Bacteroidales bacterium]